MKLVRGITIPANPDAPAVLRTIRQSHLPDYQRWVGGHLKALALTKPLGILYMEYSSSGAFNGRATSLVRKHRELPGNEVRGDVILFGSIDAYGNDVDVHPDYIAELSPQTERYRVEVRFPSSSIWSRTSREYDDYEEALRLSSHMANQYDGWRIVPTDHPSLERYEEGSEDGTGPREKV